MLRLEKKNIRKEWIKILLYMNSRYEYSARRYVFEILFLLLLHS